jgi:hypothetical protein
MANRFLPGRYIVFGSVPVFQRGNGTFQRRHCESAREGGPDERGRARARRPSLAWRGGGLPYPARSDCSSTPPSPPNKTNPTSPPPRGASEREIARAHLVPNAAHATPPRDATETASQAGSIAAESPTARQEHRGRLSSSRGSQSARLSQSVKTEAAAAATTTRGGGGPAIECERRRDPCRAAIRDDGGGRRDGRGDGRRRPLGRRDPRRRRGPQPAHLPPAPTRRVPAPRPRHRRYVVPPSHSVCACATEIPCSLPPPEFW